MKWIAIIPIKLDFYDLFSLPGREWADVLNTQCSLNEDFHDNWVKAEFGYDLKKDAHGFLAISCDLAHSHGVNNAGCAHCFFLWPG